MGTDPINRGRQTAMVVVSVIMTVLGAICLILRVISRWIVLRRLGADDWFMVVGMLFTFGYLFEILYGLKFGIGLHTSDDSVANMIELLKLVYAIQLTYNTIIAAIKISIVCFYLRIGSIDRFLRFASWGTILFLTLFYISTQIASTLQCLPIKSNWDLTGTTEKKCFNTEVYFYILAVVNIIVDIWILAIPIRTLKDIKRPTRDKIALFIVFGIGAFSCVSSIIRLYTIKVFTASKDPFYDGVPINIWSMIEVNVAIVCASVPAMKPLFSKNVLERVTNSKNSRSAFRSQYGHQMIPLSGTDKAKTNGYRDGVLPKNGYTVNATSKHDTGSEEFIIGKNTGIEYEREFIVEETYLETPDEVAQPPKAHRK